MGKIYQYQTKLRIKVPVGIDLSNATTYIVNVSPTGSVGTWGGTIEQPPSNGTIYYDVEGTYDLNEIGLWRFWGVVVDSDGKRAPGEPFTEYIYEEGTPE